MTYSNARPAGSYILLQLQKHTKNSLLLLYLEPSAHYVKMRSTKKAPKCTGSGRKVVILTQAISRVVSCCRPDNRKTLAFFRIAAFAVLAAVFALPQFAGATVVRMETDFGNIDIELYDEEAPKTVANFLRYAGRQDYTNNGFIHRSVPGFVIQGGGFVFAEVFGTSVYFHIPEDPPVQNEFSLSRSNVRGTIAMAKVGGNPDSATSEWFFNLSDDNALNLDYQNGGFTVFGRVLDKGPGTGMNVVDAIAALDVCKAIFIDPACSVYNSAFTDLPVINYDQAAGLKTSNLVKINRIPNVAAVSTPSGNWAVFTTDVEMTFNLFGTIDAATAVSWLSSFTSPPNQSVYFNNGMFTLKMSGPMDANGRIVTLHDGAANRPTRYYAYGKTPDNQTDHWYDFSYDSATGTGAEIVGDKILLHFVDGQRGDEDLTANNSITHTGAQAVVTSTSSTDAQSGGCSIVSTPSQTMRGGDWIAVSLFLVFVAFLRRRTRRQRF